MWWRHVCVQSLHDRDNGSVQVSELSQMDYDGSQPVDKSY